MTVINCNCTLSVFVVLALLFCQLFLFCGADSSHIPTNAAESATAAASAAGSKKIDVTVENEWMNEVWTSYLGCMTSSTAACASKPVASADSIPLHAPSGCLREMLELKCWEQLMNTSDDKEWRPVVQAIWRMNFTFKFDAHFGTDPPIIKNILEYEQIRHRLAPMLTFIPTEQTYDENTSEFKARVFKSIVHARLLGGVRYFHSLCSPLQSALIDLVYQFGTNFLPAVRGFTGALSQEKRALPKYLSASAVLQSSVWSAYFPQHSSSAAKVFLDCAKRFPENEIYSIESQVENADKNGWTQNLETFRQNDVPLLLSLSIDGSPALSRSVLDVVEYLRSLSIKSSDLLELEGRLETLKRFSAQKLQAEERENLKKMKDEQENRIMEEKRLMREAKHAERRGEENPQRTRHRLDEL